MQFGNKGKLNPHYVCLYLVLKRVGKVIYDMDLPSNLISIHPFFLVWMLRNCVGNLSLVIPSEAVGIINSFSYEEVLVEILDRQVCRLWMKDMASVKFH